MTNPEGLARAREMVGSQIAGYRVEAEIGRGGMGAVYLAREVGLGRRVALKVMDPALTRDDAFRRRFIREAQLAASVDHPHIIPIFAAGEVDGLLYIAMRYVDGEDLRRLLARHGPLPAERALTVLTQIASALDAAHATGIVHRDVKPANILVGSTGDPHHPEDHTYLVDFGLTRKSVSLSGLTGVGQLVGTLHYIAPEQIENHQLDGRTDQYALACTAFETFTGVLPFDCEDDRALMFAHLFTPPPALSAHRPDLPSAADGVLATALAKNPADRYPTCQEFVDALRAATTDPHAPATAERIDRLATVTDQRQRLVPKPDAAPGGGRSPARRAPARTRGHRRRTVAAVAAVLLIVLAMLAGTVLTQEDPGPSATQARPLTGGPADASQPATPVAAGSAAASQANSAPQRGPADNSAERPGAAPGDEQPRTATGGRIYVTNHGSASVSVIDAATNATVATIPVEAYPSGVATTPDRRRLFIVHRGSGRITAVDTATDTPSVLTPLSAGDHWDIAVAPDGRRAFVTNRGAGTVSVIDIARDTVVSTIRTAANPSDSPVEIAVGRNGTRAYVTNRGAGTLAVIDTNRNNMIASVAVQGAPNGVAVTPDGRAVYVTNEGADTVSIVDATRNRVVKTVRVGDAPITVAFSPNGRRAYVVDRGSKAVSVINTATRRVVERIFVGGDPGSLAVTPDGSRLLVANGGTDGISVIDTARNAVLRTTTVDQDPFGLAIVPP